jgi:hypothetical protein
MRLGALGPPRPEAFAAAVLIEARMTVTVANPSDPTAPPARRIDPRWKVAYLVAVTIATFSAPAKVRPLVVSGLLLLQVVILLKSRATPGDIFRLATRLKVVFLFLVGCYLLLPGEEHDRVVRWPVGLFDWSLGLNLTGLKTACLMCGQMMTVTLASAVLRQVGEADFVEGLRSIRCPRLLAYSFDNILALFGGGIRRGQGGKRRGSGGGQGRDGHPGPGLGAISRQLLRGDTSSLAAAVRSGVERAGERSHTLTADGDSRLAHDVTVISGLGLLMMSLKLLRVFPGVPFASGYKTIVLFPLYILAAQLTYSRFGATTAGLIVGLVGLLNGDGRFGVFEVFRHVVPGVVIDLLWPLFRRLPRRVWIYSALGVIASVCRVSTELLLGLCLGARWEIYLGLSFRLTTNLLAGILSGGVTYALLPAFQQLEPVSDQAEAARL